MKDGILGWVTWLVGIITSLGIGGLFVNETFTNVFLLNYLPLIVHQVIGGIIIISAIWLVIQTLMKEFK